MCDICGFSPCRGGCPGAPEEDDPLAVFVCAHCGEPIRNGETCITTAGAGVSEKIKPGSR